MMNRASSVAEGFDIRARSALEIKILADLGCMTVVPEPSSALPALVLADAAFAEATQPGRV